MGIGGKSKKCKANKNGFSPSNNIIKEYLKMHGKFITKNKVIALKRSINETDKSKCTESAIKLIESKLIILEKRMGNGAKVLINENDLQELKKTLNNSSNKKSEIGTIYSKRIKGTRMCKSRKFSDAGKGACSHHKGLAGILTAEEIASKEFDL